MSKSRKTRKEKILSEQRRAENETFQVKAEWLKTGTKKGKRTIVTNEPSKKHMLTDLTKTLVISMLVLALELAIWMYLSRH